MEGHRRLDTRLSACGTVLTRAAGALVHIDVTVASQAFVTELLVRHHHTIAISAIALLHIALTRILHNEAVRWITAITCITIILTHTVGEASHTCALVCMEGHTRLDTRLSACGTVLTRAAVALVDIKITVASQTRCVGLQMRCHQTIVLAIAL